jgi:hypothetical protein
VEVFRRHLLTVTETEAHRLAISLNQLETPIMNSVVAAFDQVVSSYMGRSLNCDPRLQGIQENEPNSQQDTQRYPSSTLALQIMNVPQLSLPSLNTTQLELTSALNAASTSPTDDIHSLQPYQGDYTDTNNSLGLDLNEFSTAEDSNFVPSVLFNEQNVPQGLAAPMYSSRPKHNNNGALDQSLSGSLVPHMPHSEAPSLDALAEGHSADFVGCPFPIVDENRQRRLLFASKGEDPGYSGASYKTFGRAKKMALHRCRSLRIFLWKTLL